MEKKFKALLREKERIIQELTAELARSHTENISIRNQWFDVFEEMEKEYERKFKALMRRNEQLEKRALKAERKLDEANNKITVQRRRMYELETALEDEKEKT